MAVRWSTEQVVAEFKDFQASAMAVDCVGQWALLAGRKNLAFVDLNKPSQTVVKVTRQSKWDIGCVQWNRHASHAYRFVTACNQRLDVFDFRDASAVHLCSLKAHSRTVSDIDWSPFDVNVVASCSVDTFTYFWDVRDSKKPVKSFQTVSGAYQVKWNKVTNNLFATTHDGDVRIWDPRKGNTPVQYISAHPSKIHGLDWSNTDQNKLVTASQDCNIRVWDYNNPRKSEAMINSGNPVWRARYTPFGEGVVSVVVPQLRRGENSLYLWHIRNQASPVHTFVGHKDVILEFQWRKQPEGARDHQLVTWSKDQSLRIWKVDPTMQKSCGYEIDDLEDCLVEDDTPSQNTSHFNGFESVTNKRLDTHSSDRTRANSGPVRGGTQLSLMSSRLSVLTLGQELNEVIEQTPGVKLEEADLPNRTLTFKLTKGQNSLDISVSFPEKYPIRVAPQLTILQSNLDPDVYVRIMKVFNDTSSIHVKKNVNCLEPCIKQIMLVIEKSGTPTLTQDIPSAVEDRKSMLDKKFHVEKVRQPTSPVAQSNVSPMYPTGGFQDLCIPFPRTCGASFCSNDFLVTFAVPAALKKVNEDSEVTPRALSDLVSYSLSQSQWMRNQSNSFVSLSLFYSSPPPQPPEGISVSSFYTEKSSKNRHHRSSHHHHKSRSRDSRENKPDKERESDRVSKKMQKVGFIKVYDISCINPVNKYLAQNYRLDLDKLGETCRHNVDVATKIGRKDLIQLWQLVCHMTQPSLKPSPNIAHEAPWAYCPFGRPLLKQMLDHSAKSRDVQTMAMLCCVFWDRDRPKKDRIPFDRTSQSKNEPRSTFEYAAANTYNPYHTVSSMTNLLKGWTSINKTGSATAASLPPHTQQQISPSPFPLLSPVPPPPPSSSPSSLLASGSARGKGRTMAEVASQPNLAALFRAGRSKSGKSAAVIKSKRSFSWSESCDEFTRVEDNKDPREREMEREKTLHYNNSQMLDPELRPQYEQIKKAYANILFKWGLLNERAHILKHTDSTDTEHRVIECRVSCFNCSEDVRGAQCHRCKYPALRCSICHIGVRGLSIICLACGDGGHTSHMMTWFSQQSVCPTGCGCVCLQENTFRSLTDQGS
ncbi:unnamed protein product [Lymnaea stagnalis]|uniref:WDR59/RTC1-like RING zinc finger domain-containing protein n=1 Tax=Lymnaea stagnalis TaxID=6523 RepID=A0AAV2H6F4_LYMST